MAARQLHNHVANALSFWIPNALAVFVQTSSGLNSISQSPAMRQGALHLWATNKFGV